MTFGNPEVTLFSENNIYNFLSNGKKSQCNVNILFITPASGSWCLSLNPVPGVLGSYSEFS